MAIVQPIVLGMLVEELYCLLKEHPIYLMTDQEEWTSAVQRRIGQLSVVARTGEFDDGVSEALASLGRGIAELPGGDDLSALIAPRTELAAIVDFIMGALDDRHEGRDRAEYEVGIFVRRIGFCANAVAASN